jgi:uncharacterized membrane protein YfcA
LILIRKSQRTLVRCDFLRKKTVLTAIAGAVAGIINGLFGAGGGIILVPMLTRGTGLEDREIFPASISIILPICLVTLTMGQESPLPWADALPYLAGSAIGGFLAGKFGARIPTLWMHKGLGLLILWGGVRYLC